MPKSSIVLIYHGRFPAEKAAPLFAAESCEAFADLDAQVVLLVPRRLGRSKENAAAYYHLRHTFPVIFLPTIDLMLLPFLKYLTFLLSFVSFSCAVFFYLLFNANNEDVIYSNETLPLWLASFRFGNTFFEMHDFPESKFFLFKRFCRRMRWILIHNRWKAEEFRKKFALPNANVLYQPNAVDIQAFDITISKTEARAALHLPQETCIVVYTGSLFRWKGVDTLAQAAAYLPDNFLIAFVGGSKEDEERFRKLYGDRPKLMIVGYRKHEEIPLWQKAGDVLVLPNTATEDISKFYTSPMKLFEYMASKRPIVASDIPSITEILNSENAILVEPDNAERLAEGLKEAAEHPARSQSLIVKAFEDVSGHTWEKRAAAILAFTGLSFTTSIR